MWCLFPLTHSLFGLMRAILPQSLHITLNTSVKEEAASEAGGPALQKVPDPVKSRRYFPKDTLV